MEKVLAVSEITLKRVKEPAFNVLFIIAAVFGYCVSEMEALSIHGEDATIGVILASDSGTPLLTGFVMIILMTMLIAVFSGATDIPRDVESRMVMFILSKPISRGEYVLGKYIGVVSTCLLFFILACISTVLAHLIKAGELYSLTVLVRQSYLLIAILPFVAMTMMISTFLSDISAMIVAAVYIMFALSMSAMSIFVDMLPKSLGVASYVHVIAYFFPNYFYFFNSFKIFGVVVLSLLVYALSLTVIFLAIGTLKFNRRDLIE
ncbi:MAG: ABC transporter permease subunit [Victivallales bacterium]|nr:ABC transporter permease subunit [Victivallales bacterium]